MARFTLQITSVLVFTLAMILLAGLPARSDSSTAAGSVRPVVDASYRSSISSHKVIVYPYEQELRDEILAGGGSVIEEYGAFSLLSAPSHVAAMVSSRYGPASPVRDDMNVLLLRAGSFDTTEGEPQVLEALSEPQSTSPDDEQLYLVQMIGPVKREWLEWLSSSAEVISYIPNNAYLVRSKPAAFSALELEANSPGSFVQWSGSFKPAFKIAPEILLDSNEEITVTVQLATGRRTADEILAIGSQSASILGEPLALLNYTDVRVRIQKLRLIDIARMNDVIWIEPWQEPQMSDERQDQIVSGNLSGNQLTGPGYVTWLQSKGLASTPDFIIDVSDSGIDRGSLDPALLHRDFLSVAGVPRIAYAQFAGTPGLQGGTLNDITGHGTLNASVLGGYNNGSSFPDTDAEGYRFGLGVHPFARLGITKIFDPDFTSPNLQSMVSSMYARGARVSSNSWGSDVNVYTTSSQAYDSLVRDAQSAVAGNQEMSIVFAAGNKGLNGHMAAPANAKNVIAVGATENLRPAGTDGCNVTSEGADDISSVVRFSGGGPVLDGRTKPDIVAPGTHIQGAQSQDPQNTGRGVCGPKNFPPGQSLYTWSSGTSHSTPAVAGAAGLVRQYFRQSIGRAPSPAMIKAYLTNSTTYLTGNFAGDNLPSNSQGWGLLNLKLAFDSTPRILVDQEQPLTSTGQVYTVRGRVADPGKQVRITLAWTDAPGSASANPVVNDLDLQVEQNGHVFVGNHFNGNTSYEGGSADKLNNVEAVWLPDGTSGEFLVRVIAANIPGDGVPGNSTATDQDFALVVYNAQAISGGGGGGSLDLPPTATLRYPVGGERVVAGSHTLIRWDSSDDKGILNHWVELSTDSGSTYRPIAILDGKARFFDWLVPNIPTTRARIKIRVLDGINFPVSVASASDFEIAIGPPDTTPPRVTLVSPRDGDVVPAGSTVQVKWSESDNVGVIRRVIDLSTDGGDTFSELTTIAGPGVGDPQSFGWQVPATLSASKAKVRVTVFDGSNNSAVILGGKFQVWALPVITAIEYKPLPDGRNEFGVAGRNFRQDETEIYVDDILLKKVRFFDENDNHDGTFSKVYSYDKKLPKRVRLGTFVTVVVKLPRTGQVSPPFQFRRKN